LRGRPSADELATIEIHLRKAGSILGGRHAGMAHEQTAEESDINRA